MKKKYKILITIFVIEILGVSILSEAGISVQSWLGNAIGALLVLGPILILLYLLKKDDDVLEKYRTLSKIVFCFIVFCYLAGAVGKAIALGLIRL